MSGESREEFERDRCGQTGEDMRSDPILDKLRVMHDEMGALLNHKCHIIAHYQECGDCREYNRLDASYTKWCLSYVAGIFAREKHPNFPQSSSLVPQGAESADIGKLETADKSGVEMGKVNRESSLSHAPDCICVPCMSRVTGELLKRDVSLDPGRCCDNGYFGQSHKCQKSNPDSSLSSPPPEFRHSEICLWWHRRPCNRNCLSNFRQFPSLSESGAESAHSGKQNTADKSELLPTQLPAGIRETVTLGNSEDE